MQTLETALAPTPTTSHSHSQPASMPQLTPVTPEQHDVAAPRSRGLAPHRLQRVLSCIEVRLAEHVQVRELADEIHMSPFHFARMFKLATSHAPHAYITLQRMERAKQLLEQSDLALAEVASRVGYQTQAHFTGVFHKHVGVTPRVYRISSRSKAADA